MPVRAWRLSGMEWLHPTVVINYGGELLSLILAAESILIPAGICERCRKPLQSGRGADLQFTPHLLIRYFPGSQRLPWRCCLECWRTPLLEFQEGEDEPEEGSAQSVPDAAGREPAATAERYQTQTKLKFLLIKAASFDQIWSDYYAYCRTSPPSNQTWSWRHFLIWAQTANPEQVKTSYNFRNELLSGEWVLVKDVLVDALDDPSENLPQPQQ